VLEVKVDSLLTPREETGLPLCTVDQIQDGSCDASPLSSGAFEPRATGGTSLLEGSLELRAPIAGRVWEGAAFLDFGRVWGEYTRVSLADLELTPGLGVRYFSPIGPIRVDLAYRFAEGEALRVVTSEPPPSGKLTILGPRVVYGALDTWSLQRFQIHLSIGQAF
jgi:outer membrane protein assembly factor BamA